MASTPTPPLHTSQTPIHSHEQLEAVLRNISALEIPIDYPGRTQVVAKMGDYALGIYDYVIDHSAHDQIPDSSWWMNDSNNSLVHTSECTRTESNGAVLRFFRDVEVSPRYQGKDNTIGLKVVTRKASSNELILSKTILLPSPWVTRKAKPKINPLAMVKTEHVALAPNDIEGSTDEFIEQSLNYLWPFNIDPKLVVIWDGSASPETIFLSDAKEVLGLLAIGAYDLQTD